MELVPLVGITCCRKGTADLPHHQVGEKYITAVTRCAGAMPMLIPALPDEIDFGAMARRLDGLLITGSPSDVEPKHYDGGGSHAGTLHDPHRDGTTLPLIRAALQEGVPVFGICRGHQELNVALGGSLHQRVHQVSGRMDHRGIGFVPIDYAYDPANGHPVQIIPGGVLDRILGDLADADRAVMVNSLHGQAIDRLAPGLTVEALAPDGTIEAVSVAGAKSFALSFQWHPEWRAEDNPVSTALFRAFGDAVRMRARQRLQEAVA